MPDDRIDHSMMEDSALPTPNWSETLANAWSKDSPTNGTMSPGDSSRGIPGAVAMGVRAATPAGEVCTEPPGPGKTPMEPRQLEFPPITQESPTDAQGTREYPGRFRVPEAVTGLELLLRTSKTAAEIAVRGLRDAVIPPSLIPLDGVFTPAVVPLPNDAPAASEQDDSSFSRSVLKGVAEGVAFPIRGLIPFDAIKTDRHQPPIGVGPQDKDHDQPGKSAHGDKARAVEEGTMLRKLFQNRRHRK